jgi:hypothetical protein
MKTMTDTTLEVKDWVLKVTDRCDSCGAEALVKVSGINGELYFCGHHYNKIMSNPTGYDNMMKFAITFTDERSKLEK